MDNQQGSTKENTTSDPFSFPMESVVQKTRGEKNQPNNQPTRLQNKRGMKNVTALVKRPSVQVEKDTIEDSQSKQRVSVANINDAIRPDDETQSSHKSVESLSSPVPKMSPVKKPSKSIMKSPEADLVGMLDSAVAESVIEPLIVKRVYSRSQRESAKMSPVKKTPNPHVKTETPEKMPEEMFEESEVDELEPIDFPEPPSPPIRESVVETGDLDVFVRLSQGRRRWNEPVVQCNVVKEHKEVGLEVLKPQEKDVAVYELHRLTRVAAKPAKRVGEKVPRKEGSREDFLREETLERKRVRVEGEEVPVKRARLASKSFEASVQIEKPSKVKGYDVDCGQQLSIIMKKRIGSLVHWYEQSVLPSIDALQTKITGLDYG